MSEFNSILSDSELRDLLQRFMLEEDSPVTEQLIEMESKIAFGSAPVMAAVLPNESEMIGKLAQSFAGKSGILAWAIGLGIASVLGVGAYVYSTSGGTKESTPNHKHQDTPVKENVVPVMETGPWQNNNHIALVVPQKDTTPSIKHNVATVPVIENPLTQQKTWDTLISQTNNNSNTGVSNHTGKTALYDKSDTSKKVVRSSVDTVFKDVRKVVINSMVCDLSVAKVNTDQVKVKGGITVETRGRVTQKPVYSIEHEQKGEVLNIWIEQSSKSSVVIGSVNVNGNLDIEVPSGTDIEVNQSGGKMVLTGLNGRLCSVKNSYGDIVAEQINTGFTIHSGSGNVSLTNCTGGGEVHASYGNVNINQHKGNLTVKSSSGDIVVKQLTGDKVNISSTYGNVQLSGIAAEMELSSASGDIQLSNVTGNVSMVSSYGNQVISTLTGNLITTSASGNIKINQLRGDLSVRSSYGNVIASNCNGNISVKSQSGDIKGSSIRIQDALELSSGYGDIMMQLENPLDELSFDLVASYGDVKVKKDGTSISGDKGKLFLQKGKIKVKATTTSGNQVYE